MTWEDLYGPDWELVYAEMMQKLYEQAANRAQEVWNERRKAGIPIGGPPLRPVRRKSKKVE